MLPPQKISESDSYSAEFSQTFKANTSISQFISQNRKIRIIAKFILGYHTYPVTQITQRLNKDYYRPISLIIIELSIKSLLLFSLERLAQFV